MFVLCPHCEFLVGVDPRTGQPPATCPKCGQALETVQEEQPPVPVDVVVDVPMVAIDVAAPVEAAPVEVAPAEVPPEPPAPQLSADAVIAAMAAKPRKSRAKPRSEPKPPKQEAPPRRKRATPAPEAAPSPAQPAVAAVREKTPSLAQRLASWWSARSQSTASPEPARAEPTQAPKRKASVRPIPSLRDRAAAKHAKPLPEIEALSIGEAPTTPPVEAVVVEPVVEAPVVGQQVVEAPVVEAPVVAEPTIDEAPIRETPPIDAPIEPTPPIAPPIKVAEAPTAPVPLPAPEPRIAPSPRVASAPSFLRKRTTTTPPHARWRHVATLGALSLLLVVQLLLAQRDALAATARWRPTITALCGALRCAVPAWRQPEAFTMLSRDVRPHARAPGTLQIDASFRNDARWAQPWPRLVVSLSDIDGRVLGTRAFTAAEYLGAPPTQNTLASGQAAAIRLAVVEPAPGVVAFSFEFR